NGDKMKLGSTTNARLLHRRRSTAARQAINSSSTTKICGCLVSVQSVIPSGNREQTKNAHKQQQVGKIEPEQISNGGRHNVGSVGDRVVAFGASERHEFPSLLLIIGCAVRSGVLLHYLRVPKTLLPILREAFSRVLEERELGMELALDEDSLATIDLDGGRKVPLGIGG